MAFAAGASLHPMSVDLSAEQQEAMLIALHRSAGLFKRSTRAYVKGKSIFAGALRGGVKLAPEQELLVSTLNGVIRECLPDHTFTTVVCNWNTMSRPHTDRFNVGLSVITSLGEHTGGDLVINGKPLQIHNRLTFFNGKEEHYNEPFKGERYSVIWFTHSSYRKLADLSPLLSLNFNPPPSRASGKEEREEGEEEDGKEDGEKEEEAGEEDEAEMVERARTE